MSEFFYIPKYDELNQTAEFIGMDSLRAENGI